MGEIVKRLLAGIAAAAILCALTGCGTGLIHAAKKGDVATLQKLLDKGADINESGLSGNCSGPPLAHAAYDCRPESVRYLIGRGADIEAVGPAMGGNRPLHLAAAEDCVEVVQLLLEAGADIHATAYRGTALTIAARKGNIKTVKLLISRGADIDDAVTTLGQEKEKEAVALIEKYGHPTAAVTSPPAPAPAASPVPSDVDAIPDFKAAPRPDALAVVIGIENYQALPTSDYSTNDARMVHGYLAALGFQPRNIELLVDQRATKSSLEKVLEVWLPNRATRASTVFVYFSGHGAPDPATGEGFIVPYDGDPNYLGVTGYSLKRLYESLGRIETKETIVVLDSCFSGAGGRSVLARGTRPLVMAAASGPLPSRMAVLSATQGSQISTSAPDKRHGVLTYFFLKALQAGKKDLADIYTFIRPRVEDAAKELNVQQVPSLTPEPGRIEGRFSL